ncbi:MAG: cotH 3, partial [Verrucomicrobiales bacterium]|nr:cotH 3 [Verrucomicrobiales bacterium]
LELDNGTNKTQSDVRDLLETCRVSDPAERWKQLDKRLDVHKFVSFVAMEVLVGHWDGYAIHTNNYRLYHDPSTDKMVFITHGLDWAFRRPNVSIEPPLKSIVGRAVFQTPEGRKLFRERIGFLSTNVFRVEVLTNRLNEAIAKLRSAGLEPAALVKVERNAGIMRERIELRGKRVAEQLRGIPIPALKFGPDGTAPVTGWRDESDRGEPLMDQVEHGGRQVLHIQANGRSRASWRTQVYLPRGRYQFTGSASTQALTGGSAGLRISGGQRRTGISTTLPWQTLSHEFEVTDDGVDVEFVCDFYAFAGEVWFDLNSLKVRRL